MGPLPVTDSLLTIAPLSGCWTCQSKSSHALSTFWNSGISPTSELPAERCERCQRRVSAVKPCSNMNEIVRNFGSCGGTDNPTGQCACTSTEMRSGGIGRTFRRPFPGCLVQNLNQIKMWHAGLPNLIRWVCPPFGPVGSSRHHHHHHQGDLLPTIYPVTCASPCNGMVVLTAVCIEDTDGRGMTRPILIPRDAIVWNAA